MNQLWHMSFAAWLFIIRAAVVYVAIIILLRLGGKRQIGQMGAGDFVAILLISNAVQNSMNGGDNSITGGLILAAVLILLSITFAYLTYRFQWFENLAEGKPTVLIRDGKIIHKNLRKEFLNPHELRSILRRQGISNINDVHLAILESDGEVSVTKTSELGENHINHNQHNES